MKKYKIIYADPPWRYKVYSKKGEGRSAESHYSTMSVEEICKLPVEKIADRDCILVKQNKKTPSLFWGMGFWTRANAEICILATKGNPKRISAKVHQIIKSPIEEHSKKPNETRNKIIALVGNLSKIELFARQKVDGWNTWGNEVQCDIDLLKYGGNE